MQLRIVLLAALVGVALASKGHGVHHLTEKDFEEKTTDGKASCGRCWLDHLPCVSLGTVQTHA